jgi:hypothetical protein
MQEVFGQGGEIERIEERLAGMYQENMIPEKGPPSGNDKVGRFAGQYLETLVQNRKNGS